MPRTGTAFVSTVVIVAAAWKQTKSIKQDLWFPQWYCSALGSDAVSLGYFPLAF
jgi:hypothetical protein